MGLSTSLSTCATQTTLTSYITLFVRSNFKSNSNTQPLGTTDTLTSIPKLTDSNVMFQVFQTISFHGRLEFQQLSPISQAMLTCSSLIFQMVNPHLVYQFQTQYQHLQHAQPWWQFDKSTGHRVQHSFEDIYSFINW